MRSHDVRRTEPARAGKSEDGPTPGKHTLVEGLGGREAGGGAARGEADPRSTGPDPANEAAKGGSDNNPKLGAGGGAGEAGGASAQETHAHDADAVDNQ